MNDLKSLSFKERRKVGEEFENSFLEFQSGIQGRCKELFPEDIYVSSPHIVSLGTKNLDEGYYKSIAANLEHGRVNYIDSGSYEGARRIEFDHATLVFRGQRDTSRIANGVGALSPWTREGLSPPTDEDVIINYFNKYLISHDLEPNEHYRYCSWIVGMGDDSVTPLDIELLARGLITDPVEKERIEKGVKLYEKGVLRGTKFNQLEWCAQHFAEKGFGTNHCSITVGCAEGLKRYDWPYKTEAEKGSTECLRTISYKIRDENKLTTTCFFRSWDLFSGLPTNLGGLTLLTEYLANMINIKVMENGSDQPMVEPGVMIATSDGLHIYQDRVESAKEWVGLGNLNKNSW